MAKGLWRTLVETGKVPADELLHHLRHTSRDHARTPMRWDTSPNGGFTTGTPWLAENPNHLDINAAAQRRDPNSVFHHHRRLIELRRRHPALVHGAFVDLDPQHPHVFAFTRTLNDDRFLVAINFGRVPQHRRPAREARRDRHRPVRGRRGLRRRRDGPVPLLPRGVHRGSLASVARGHRSRTDRRRLPSPERADGSMGTLARQPDGQDSNRADGVGLLRPPARRAPADLLGGERTEIPVGASLGMNPIDTTVEAVGAHVDQGYQRIKLKIEPGWDLELLAAVRDRFPDIELTVDANSAYTLADIDRLRGIDDFALHDIEQPLHWDDMVEHAQLATMIHTDLCLDETLTSPARVKAALDLRACSVVNVKVGRVGGLQSVREIHDLCVARKVAMWCGGMLETGIGRAHNIHLATMPGFVFPGDTASASRTYARDIVEQPLEATNGVMPVPSGPGIGVTLDRPFVQSVTSTVEVLRR